MHDEEITLEYTCINTTVNVRFSVLGENMGTAMFCLRKKITILKSVTFF